MLQTVHGLHEDLGLPVDEAHVLDDLVLRVEQLDALRVRVVARRERARVRRSELPVKSPIYLLCCPNKRGQMLPDCGFSSRNLSPRLFGQQSI